MEEQIEEMKRQLREAIKLERPVPNSILISIDTDTVDADTSNKILDLEKMKKDIGEITGSPEDLISFEASEDSMKLEFSGEEPANKVFQFLTDLFHGEMLDTLMKPFIEMIEQMKNVFGSE
ncbi:MAG: hypothetical protein ACFFCD_13480 [Promethearchaeota archaeon]